MRKILSATLAASVLAAGAAQAANPTVTTTFQVSATVQPNCTTSATGLGFGNYTPGNGAVTANSTITVNCTKATGYTIWLNPGSTTGDAYTQRLMTSGAGTLQYNLYTTAALNTVFGDGTGATGRSFPKPKTEAVETLGSTSAKSRPRTASTCKSSELAATGTSVSTSRPQVSAPARA